MNAEGYYYNKFLDWQKRENGDYKRYLAHTTKQDLVREFESDKTNGKGFGEVCNYLKTFEHGQENQGAAQIMTLIGNNESPEKDTIVLIIEATIHACNYNKTSNSLIGLAIAGLIGASVIKLLVGLDKSK